MLKLPVKDVRRLALARAGLLKPEWTGGPTSGRPAVEAALAVVRRFGYLQLDTIPITGARTQAIVLQSRLRGFKTRVGEELLEPGRPLFEGWAHQACWIPLELYPVFEFRRRAFRAHPWWGDIVGANKPLADAILQRVASDGPCRSADLTGLSRNHALTKHVASALWVAGELAVPERRGFIRTYDLPERVIPAELRDNPMPEEEALRHLVLLSVDGHGFTPLKTLIETFGLRRRRKDVTRILGELVEEGELTPASLDHDGGSVSGWIRPSDLELAARLRRVRPRADQGVLLSPFDPVLWDRDRVRMLFEFEQVLEIYKPAKTRVYGYYVLPVLAGERLVARVDLKANRKAGTLAVLSRRFEEKPTPAATAAVESALARFADAVELEITPRA